jgi:hypothetical protein
VFAEAGINQGNTSRDKEARFLLDTRGITKLAAWSRRAKFHRSDRARVASSEADYLEQDRRKEGQAGGRKSAFPNDPGLKLTRLTYVR